MVTAAGYRHIYVSPHLDDVVYSCGGRVWEQVHAGEPVLVVTVFAGVPKPDAPFSPFAQQLHARWGHTTDAALKRQEEDRAALGFLGADAVHWPYTDCIYRQTPDGGFPYASEESLWAAVHPLEDGLLAELTARVAALPLAPGGTLYAPLGVGHHVDHQLVRQVADALTRPIAYYEDFPYAAKEPQAVQAALGPGRWRAETAPLSEEALAAKVVAVACYRSQLSTFWADEAAMAAMIRASAERVGQGRPAERFWKPAPTT